MSSPAIPNFFLYGEVSQSDLPGFVHIEDIDARSRQNDWQIKPHRHGRLFQLLCLYDGEMTARLDENEHQLTGSWAVTVPPGCVHGFSFPADTQGVVLTLSDSLFTPHEQQELQSSFDDLFRSPQRIQFKKNSHEMAQIKHFFANIRRETEQMNTGYSLMLRWIVKMVLMTLKRSLEYSTPSSQLTLNLGKQSLQSYKQLLEQHYRCHWSVKQYADHLHISPTTLNRLCKKQLGTTAKGMIQDRLLLEIKRRLIYTTASHEEISDTLGFKDPSYFSRFFKKHEGISPIEYRRVKYMETGTTPSS